jgi:hypothetical protein
MIDVADGFMMMAERAFKQRDELAKALDRLLRFCDEATEYEMQHPADYSPYLDAKALLDRVSTPSHPEAKS